MDLHLSRETIISGHLFLHAEDPSPITTPLHTRNGDDHPDTWVSQSRLFPGAGLGLFFKSPLPYGFKGGTLITVYYGRDYISELLTYLQGMAKWGTDNHAASDSFSCYIVVASDKCMEGRANDGFDQFNLLLQYHKNGTQSRMELLLAGPTLPG